MSLLLFASAGDEAAALICITKTAERNREHRITTAEDMITKG